MILIVLEKYIWLPRINYRKNYNKHTYNCASGNSSKASISSPAKNTIKTSKIFTSLGWQQAIPVLNWSARPSEEILDFMLTI